MFTKYMKNQLILTPLQNLCSCLGLVHICNHGLHGFLLLNVFVKKNMKTQLILTILNFHCFSYLWFPKIFKMKMSHVCSGNAAERLFCFTSAVVLLVFFDVFNFCRTSAAKWLGGKTRVVRLRPFCSVFRVCHTSAAVLLVFWRGRPKSKPAVRLRPFCSSCNYCRTSAAVLLVSRVLVFVLRLR